MFSIHPWPNKTLDEPSVSRGWEIEESADLLLLAELMTRQPWSPCVWQDGHRKGANFRLADFVALDFDDGRLSLASAVNRWSGVRHVIGTTKSHMKPKRGMVADRFRVVFPLTRRIEDAATYRATVADMLRRYPADRACVDAARFFWPCADIISINDTAPQSTAMRPVAPPPPAPVTLSPYQVAGALPNSARRLASRLIEEIEGRHRCVLLAGLDLGMAGFSEDFALTLLRGSKTYAAMPERAKEFERTIADGVRRGQINRRGACSNSPTDGAEK